MGVLPDFMIENEVKIEPFSPCEKRPGKISYGLTSFGYDARLGYRFRVMTPHRCTAAVIDPKKDDPTAWTEIDLTPPTEHDWEAFDHGGKPYIRCRHCQVFEDNPYVKDWDAKCFATRNPDYLPIPPGGFVLGETLETFTIPRDVLCLVMGKSTYARVGIQIYVTPGEPEWSGKWTVEISNAGPLPVKIYPGEGIMQCVFLRSDAQAAYALAALRDKAGSTDFGLHAKLLEATQASCRTSYADKAGKYQAQGGLTPAKVE